MSQLLVFVSHSSSDKPFADALVRALRQAGADVWYDEHNLGAGHLLEDIQQELRARPVFIVILSQAAFASLWVVRECNWAYSLYSRDSRSRTILPVVASPIEPSDFDAMLFLEDFKRVQAPGNRPYPQAQAIEETLRLLGLTSAGQVAAGKAATPTASQPGPDVRVLIEKGEELITLDQADEAIPFLELAAEAAPDNAAAWFTLGCAHMALGDWDESLSAFEDAAGINPTDGAVWCHRGVAHLGSREPDEALEAFNRALALDNRNTLAWAGKGIAMKYLELYEGALAAFERALELRPTYGEAWAAKANVLWLLKRHDEANAAHDHAMAINPEAPLPWSYKPTSLRALRALIHDAEA